MKHLIVLATWMLIDVAIARPVNNGELYDPTSKNHQIHTRKDGEVNLYKRVVKALSSPKSARATQVPVAAGGPSPSRSYAAGAKTPSMSRGPLMAKSPVSEKSFASSYRGSASSAQSRVQAGSANRPVRRPVKPKAIAGQGSNGDAGNGRPGNGNNSNQYGKYPPAEATALGDGLGLIRTVTQDKPSPPKPGDKYVPQQIPEGITVKGRLSAAASYASIEPGGGGQVTAQGHHTASAMVSDLGKNTRGCIHCGTPGSPPTRVDIPPGTRGPITATVVNDKPHLGPAIIKAEIDGDGSISAVGANAPAPMWLS